MNYKRQYDQHLEEEKEKKNNKNSAKTNLPEVQRNGFSSPWKMEVT